MGQAGNRQQPRRGHALALGRCAQVVLIRERRVQGREAAQAAHAAPSVHGSTAPGALRYGEMLTTRCAPETSVRDAGRPWRCIPALLLGMRCSRRAARVLAVLARQPPQSLHACTADCSTRAY